MRHADFHAAGLCVGSDMVEAGCKTDRHEVETGRDALARRREQRRARSVLLQAQRSLRGLLGIQVSRFLGQSQKSDVHPRAKFDCLLVSKAVMSP